MSAPRSDSPTGYKLGDIKLDVARRRIRRGANDIQIGKLTYDLLIVLAEAAPRVVTREELTERVWGGRYVSPDAMKQQIKRLRQALTDDARHPRYINVVRGQGYALIPDVEALYDESALTYSWEPIQVGFLRMAKRSYVPIGLATAVALVAIVLYLQPSGDLASENSIAALPFTDLSENGDQEYLSDGISEELLSSLAKVPELSVAARTSAFSFKGKDVTIPEIAEALQVRHVLDGSVRRVGDRLRIAVQLIAAETDTTIWSENYDREMSDVFAIQDEIAAEVVDQLSVELLGPALTVNETDPEVYSLYLQARHINHSVLVDSLPQARHLLERAIELDPDYLAPPPRACSDL